LGISQSSRRLLRAGGSVGFTIVEMLIVIAIITVVMAIVVPSYMAMASQNRRATCAANMKAIGQGLALFREDYQCFPPDSTEYLWTEEAVESYRIMYGVEPPGDHSTATLVGAAYHPDGTPFETSVRGLGLFTLYYVGAYAAQLPPISSEPRIDSDTREALEWSGTGLSSFPWFRSSGYITELDTYHCGSNDALLVESDIARRSELPALGGWNNYDLYYRRNFWHPGRPNELTDNRNLFQPYPPADTVVTWCPHHRGSSPSAGPGVETVLSPGDRDLVLFADGSVRRMAAQQANRMYQEPSPGASWPEGPIM